MKQLDRFSISHGNYDGPRLHNDLNKLVDHLNDNFKSQDALIKALESRQAVVTNAVTNINVAGGGGGGGGGGFVPPAPSNPLNVVTVTNAMSPYTAVIATAGIQVLYLVAAGAASDTVFDLYAATGSLNTIVIKKTDANPFNVAITPNGADTIDGVNAVVNIAVQNDFLRLADTAAGAWSIY